MPEIWCYHNAALTIHLLKGDRYRNSETSLAFPSLPVQELPQLIEDYRMQGKRLMRREFRQWVRDHQG